MSNLAIKRVGKDLAEFYRTRNEMIYLFPNEEDILKGYALIVGPDKTPYEKGLFLFHYTVPSTYPTQPPKVTFLTTGRSAKVRFNPNLYACGKVCLSILGTWQGPPWVASNTLESVFVSIQSLMNEYPYYNEPGFERKKGAKGVDTAAENYNETIAYYTMLHAVIEQADPNNSYPMSEIRDLISYLFFKFESYYRERISSKMSDKSVASKFGKGDPYGGYGSSQSSSPPSYSNLLKKLDAVNASLKEKHPNGEVSIFDYQQICSKFDPMFASNGMPNSTSRPDFLTDIDMLKNEAEILDEWFAGEDPDEYESEEDEDENEADDLAGDLLTPESSPPPSGSSNESAIQEVVDKSANMSTTLPKTSHVITIDDSDDDSVSSPPPKKRSPVKNFSN